MYEWRSKVVTPTREVAQPSAVHTEPVLIFSPLFSLAWFMALTRTIIATKKAMTIARVVSHRLDEYRITLLDGFRPLSRKLHGVEVESCSGRPVQFTWRKG